MRNYCRVVSLVVVFFFSFIFFTNTAKADGAWYKAKFSIKPPVSYFDPLIAREVIMPLLRDYHSEIKFSFFERREEVNKHIFMFYFFTEENYAKTIVIRIVRHNKW